MPEQPALIWNIILTGIVGSFFWWVRGMSQSIIDIRQQISNTREEVAKTYVTKPEVEANLDRILERFDRLEKKVDRVLASRAAI
jgi:Tfp pilus assembly protein PilO